MMKENQNSSQSEKSETSSSDSPSPATTKPGSSGSASRKSQRKISRSSKTDVIASRRKTNPMVWLILVLNTLVLISLSGAAAYAWLQWQSLATAQNERETELKLELQSTVAGQMSNVESATTQKLSQFETKLNTELSASIKASESKISELSQQLTDLQGASVEDWDLAELRYLLKMAQRKVSIESDTKTAIDILSEADALLFEENNDSHLPLREAIASDVQTLKAIRLTNPAEAAIVLSSLIELSEKLMFPEPDVFYEANVYEMTDDPKDWWQNIKTVWRKMVDDFLTVEKLEEDIKPYLDEQQKSLVKAALQQSLLTARYAALNREQQLFNMAITEIKTLLSQFDPQQAEAMIFADEVKAIQNTSLSQKTNIILTAPSVYSSLFEATAPVVSNTQEEQSL